MRPRRDASWRYLLTKFSGFDADSSLSYVKICDCERKVFDLGLRHRLRDSERNLSMNLIERIAQQFSGSNVKLQRRTGGPQCNAGKR